VEVGALIVGVVFHWMAVVIKNPVKKIKYHQIASWIFGILATLLLLLALVFYFLNVWKLEVRF
jgi:hypothetical protein